MDGALAGLLERERGLLAALGATEQEQLAGLLRNLLLAVES